LLLDEKKKLIKAFKVWGPKKFMGREYDGIHRTTFIINEKGKITHIIDKPKTKIHAAEVLSCLDENGAS
jgi:peroxiredoxin Q/BCP